MLNPTRKENLSHDLACSLMRFLGMLKAKNAVTSMSKAALASSNASRCSQIENPGLLRLGSSGALSNRYPPVSSN